MILVASIDNRLTFVYFDKDNLTLEVKGRCKLLDLYDYSWNAFYLLKGVDLFIWNFDDIVYLFKIDIINPKTTILS
jgi:hypothetical protein